VHCIGLFAIVANERVVDRINKVTNTVHFITLTQCVFQDKDSKFRLILVESRIHRLARYYKTKKVLPPNWK